MANEYYEYSSAGEAIKETRKKKGLTQKQLAQKSGLAAITIQQYERNLREPRLANLIKIAHALDVSPESLFGYTRIDIMTKFDKEKLDYCNPGIFSDANIRHMSKLLKQLNFNGQEKAIEQVELLTKIPEYQKDFSDQKEEPDNVTTIDLAPNVTHAFNPSEEEKKRADDIMNDDSSWD